MKIQQNMDVQNNIIKDQSDVNSASKSTRKNKNSAVVSGAALKENSPLSQRQSLAKRKALKVVSDAFGGEKKEEKKEEAERLEKEAMQQEMIENIKERAADVSSAPILSVPWPGVNELKPTVLARRMLKRPLFLMQDLLKTLRTLLIQKLPTYLIS